MTETADDTVGRYDLSYDGPAAGIRLLAGLLESDGVDVVSTSGGDGFERRDAIGALAVAYGLGMVVNGSYDVIKERVMKFMGLYPDTKVTVTKGKHRK